MKWLYKVDLDPALKPIMMDAIQAMEGGIINSVSFQTGPVNIKLTARADGRIKVKWDYKDKGEEEQ